MANSGKIDSETEEFLRMQKALTMQELLQIPKELRNLEHCKVIIDGIKVIIMEAWLKFCLECEISRKIHGF
jgi:hypothetical protein